MSDPTPIREESHSWWDTTFLVLVATLSSTIVLKIAQIQYLELIYFVQLAVLLVSFHRSHYRVRLHRTLARLGSAYGIFCFFALVLSIAALRFDYFLPDEISWLKYPVVITISRILELVASVAIMLYLVTEFGRSLDKLRFTMQLFYWTGCASAVFSILSYPLDVAGIVSLGTYSDSHRMRGFMNEGGPYGLYLLAVILVGIALFRRGWVSGGRLALTAAILTIAFLKSESKAALVAALALFLLNGLLARSMARRIVVIGAALVFLVVTSQVVDLAKGIRTYEQASAAYERLSQQHRGDTSFVLGRVAGAFIVPRMIAAHPWTGVGWGNYANLRNAPEYRGASAWADVADDPGLGVLGTAAELGVPLVAYLLLCLAFPYLYLRRLQTPTYVTNLALLQPVVHIFGAQLNMTYPWIITAFALGLAYATEKSKINADGLVAVA